MNKSEKKILFIFLITLLVGMMVAAGYYIHKEYSGAKDFCKSVDGEFKFKIKHPTMPYICNGEPIIHYYNPILNHSSSKFWGFNSSYPVILP